MPLFKKNEEQAEETKAVAAKAKQTSEEKTASTKDLYAETPAKTAKGATRKVSAQRIARANEVLVRPLVTEKGTDLNVLGKYLFEVSESANKIEVAKAVEALYGVKPVKVNIVNIEGKVKNYGRRQGKRKDWKKAVVSLPKGKTIDVYEGV